MLYWYFNYILTHILSFSKTNYKVYVYVSWVCDVAKSRRYLTTQSLHLCSIVYDEMFIVTACYFSNLRFPATRDIRTETPERTRSNNGVRSPWLYRGQLVENMTVSGIVVQFWLLDKGRRGSHPVVRRIIDVVPNGSATLSSRHYGLLRWQPLHWTSTQRKTLSYKNFSPTTRFAFVNLVRKQKLPKIVIGK